MSTTPKSAKLTEKVYLDRKSGKQTHTYFVADKPCPKVLLSSPLARRYSGYTLIKVDLLDALSWLQEAYRLIPAKLPESKQVDSKKVDRYLHSNGDAPFKLVKALWFSALVLYGKCFTQAEGRRVKLERSNLQVEFRGYHDEMMTLRHTIVAHAGQTSHEFAELYLILDPHPRRARYWLRANVKRLNFCDDRKDPVTFGQLIDEALKHVQEKLDELEKIIAEKDLFVQPLEKWYAKAGQEGG